MKQQQAYYLQEAAAVVDDEVEKSPETLNAEPESQLNHTNMFVKNNLNEEYNEAGPDIASTSVCAEKRKHDEENSREDLPPKKRVSRNRSRSRSKSLLSSNDMEELEDEDEKKEEAHEKGKYVKLNQKCQVSICPLLSRWNLNPVFMYNEINRVIRIRLAELKSEVGHLNSQITKGNGEHVMEMEVAKEREISLTEQVNTFNSHNSF